MKPEELKHLSIEDLNSKLKGLEEELFKLNFQRRSGQVDKPHRFSLIKKDIARIKTFLNIEKIKNEKK